MPLPDAPEALSHTRRGTSHVVQMQRRRLLSAFAEVLAQSGLEAAGVGRVCARAGVSRRTFYDLFDDREDCFAAAFDAAIERISAVMLAACSPSGRWHERVRSGLAALLELFDEDPGLVRVCLMETLKGGPAVRRRRAHVLDLLANAVDEGRLSMRGAIGPVPLTAESIVGGAISVVCARFLEHDRAPSEPAGLSELLNPLMSMIVQPYLGRAAARRELEHSLPPCRPASGDGAGSSHVHEPFRDLPIRITFRTARVLATIAALPGASNREIADAAGVADQGQMSKLLRRLEASGLIENGSGGHEKGEPNAWRLTERGEAVQQTIQLP